MDDRNDLDVRDLELGEDEGSPGVIGPILQEHSQDPTAISDADEVGVIYNMSNTGHSPIQVPGFNHVPFYYELHDSKRFAHGFNDWCQDPCPTARELFMTAIMNDLTDKKDWQVDIFNDEIIGTWREEASPMPLFSENCWQWCLAELRDKVKVFEATKCVRVLDTGSCVWKSDMRVSPELAEELREYTSLLYTELKREMGPSHKILSLVDPSLYPLVYGRTPVLSNGGSVNLEKCVDSYESGLLAPSHSKNAPSRRILDRIYQGKERPFDRAERLAQDLGMLRWSSRFQWLPCEVEFTGDEGSDVAITSYINNLSPLRHRPLYGIIERLVSLAIEPWNKSLIKGKTGPVPIRIRTYDAIYNSDQEPRESGESPSTHKESDPQHPEPGIAFSYQDWKDGQNGAALVDLDHEYVREIGVSPDYKHEKHDMYECNLQDSFRKKGLQVIVKMSSIELTPSQSSISAGGWTMDGMMNEHIAATAMYVYDESNVTDAKTSFRQEILTEPGNYDCFSSDPGSFAEVFGLNREQYEDGPSVQEFGSVSMPKGRLLTWPNTVQHRFEPFELINKDEPGHRRFIVLWLVDPHYRICSTRNVPPQRHDWWFEAAKTSMNLAGRGVPPEIGNLISDHTDSWPIGINEAEKNRVDMAEEHLWVNTVIEDRSWSTNSCYCMVGDIDY